MSPLLHFLHLLKEKGLVNQAKSLRANTLLKFASIFSRARHHSRRSFGNVGHSVHSLGILLQANAKRGNNFHIYRFHAIIQNVTKSEGS